MPLRHSVAAPAAALALLMPLIAPPAFAAGNGAGAGGAGARRSINSGLPPGEPGPAGSPNNRRAAPTEGASPTRGSPRPETPSGTPAAR